MSKNPTEYLKLAQSTILCSTACVLLLACSSRLPTVNLTCTNVAHNALVLECQWPPSHWIYMLDTHMIGLKGVSPCRVQSELQSSTNALQTRLTAMLALWLKRGSEPKSIF